MGWQLQKSVSGNTVTVSVTNTGQSAASTRVRVRVTLVGGASETLESQQITVEAGETEQVQLTASGPIQAADDPEPF